VPHRHVLSLAEKLAARNEKTNVFIDPQGYRNALKQAEKDFQKRRREDPRHHATDELTKARVKSAPGASFHKLSVAFISFF
jgi:hypothetical protein